MKTEFTISDIFSGAVLREKGKNNFLRVFEYGIENPFLAVNADTPVESLDLSQYILLTLDEVMDGYLDGISAGCGCVDVEEKIDLDIEVVDYPFTSGHLVAYAINKGWHISMVHDESCDDEFLALCAPWFTSHRVESLDY